MSNPELSVGMYGDRVGRLQAILLRAGYDISWSEIDRQFFGPATRCAVQSCQNDTGMLVTGVADEHTVATIAALAKDRPPSSQPANVPSTTPPVPLVNHTAAARAVDWRPTTPPDASSGTAPGLHLEMTTPGAGTTVFHGPATKVMVRATDPAGHPTEKAIVIQALHNAPQTVTVTAPPGSSTASRMAGDNRHRMQIAMAKPADDGGGNAGDYIPHPKVPIGKGGITWTPFPEDPPPSRATDYSRKTPDDAASDSGGDALGAATGTLGSFSVGSADRKPEPEAPAAWPPGVAPGRWGDGRTVDERLNELLGPINPEDSTFSRDEINNMFGFGGGGCFTRGTLVATEHGLIPIEHIHTGDNVYALDLAHHNLVLEKVRGVIEVQGEEILALDFGIEEIQCTPAHRFFTGQWVAAKDLVGGDVVLNRDSRWIQLRDTRLEAGVQPVFNLNLDGVHNYLVGDAGLVVHNVKLEEQEGQTHHVLSSPF